METIATTIGQETGTSFGILSLCGPASYLWGLLRQLLTSFPKLHPLMGPQLVFYWPGMLGIKSDKLQAP